MAIHILVQMSCIQHYLNLCCTPHSEFSLDHWKQPHNSRNHPGRNLTEIRDVINISHEENTFHWFKCRWTAAIFKRASHQAHISWAVFPLAGLRNQSSVCQHSLISAAGRTRKPPQTFPLLQTHKERYAETHKCICCLCFHADKELLN